MPDREEYVVVAIVATILCCAVLTMLCIVNDLETDTREQK